MLVSRVARIGQLMEMPGSWRKISVEKDFVGAEAMRTQMLRNVGRLDLTDDVAFGRRPSERKRMDGSERRKCRGEEREKNLKEIPQEISWKGMGLIMGVEEK